MQKSTLSIKLVNSFKVVSKFQKGRFFMSLKGLVPNSFVVLHPNIIWLNGIITQGSASFSNFALEISQTKKRWMPLFTSSSLIPKSILSPCETSLVVKKTIKWNDRRKIPHFFRNCLSSILIVQVGLNGPSRNPSVENKRKWSFFTTTFSIRVGHYCY